MTFGEELRKQRKQAGFTQKELAKKWGIAVSRISSYELGTAYPPEETLKKITTFFEMDQSCVEVAKRQRFRLEQKPQLTELKTCASALYDALVFLQKSVGEEGLFKRPGEKEYYKKRALSILEEMDIHREALLKE